MPECLVHADVCRWYHGLISRQMAYVRLQEMGESGAYLVRDSQNQAGDYAISYLSKLGQIHHFKINAICGDYYIGGRQFSSLGDMIGYYANCSCILENERLEVPVLPPKVSIVMRPCSFLSVLSRSITIFSCAFALGPFAYICFLFVSALYGVQCFSM